VEARFSAHVQTGPGAHPGSFTTGSALKFLGPEPALGVSRRDIQKRLSRWLANEHWAKWQGVGDTQRQARELISGLNLGTKAKFLTFNRTQSRVVTPFLTGYNILRRHLHLLGLLDSPLCRRCGAQEETSAHIRCECEALASLRHAYLGSFSWSWRILRVSAWGPSGTSVRLRGSHDLMWDTKGPSLRPRCIGAVRSRTQILINQSIKEGVSGQQHAPAALYPWERPGTHCTGG